MARLKIVTCYTFTKSISCIEIFLFLRDKSCMKIQQILLNRTALELPNLLGNLTHNTKETLSVYSSIFEIFFTVCLLAFYFMALKIAFQALHIASQSNVNAPRAYPLVCL